MRIENHHSSLPNSQVIHFWKFTEFPYINTTVGFEKSSQCFAAICADNKYLILG